MNIITVCLMDSWVKTHLMRFLYLAKRVMPTARYYLIVPTTETDKDKLATFRERALRHFDDVKFIHQQFPQGRLLFFDFLRSTVLDAFNLDEGLYMDPDIDVLEDLSGLPDEDPDADLLWVPNPVQMAHVKPDLEAFGFPTDPPYMEPGFIYMRRSFKPEFQLYMKSGKVDITSMAPGMSIWTAISRSEGVKAYMLPQEYNVTSWAVNTVFRAKTVHFTGVYAKQWRPHWNYVGANPRTIVLTQAAMPLPGVKW